jgi:hypothetical protein
MTPYKTLSGDSGVTAYEIRKTAILVKFRGGGSYLYDYQTPGRSDVEEMKRLAVEGRGLASYISQHVRKRYARKL